MPGVVQAAPTIKQRQEVQALRTEVRKAGNLYQQGKYQDSAEVVRQVQKRVESLAAEGDGQLLTLLEPVYRSLVRAHALLELEGIALPALKKPEPSEPSAPDSDSQVSFTEHVAPILMGKCGRCHVNDSKGDFNLASYAALMRGPAAGVVIFPGQPDGSRLIEVIESGDMPRGGLKISAEEMGTLKQWIAAGARFDGPNPQANLASLVPAEENQPPVEVMEATGEETVSFARDVAPVLTRACAGCHGRARQVRGGLNLTSFQGLLRGGDSGPPVVPGQSAESLLVKKLHGTAEGQRMPLNGEPLSESVMAKIETWITEGARFDGPDPDQDIAQVAALARAQAASHEELSAERMELAEQNWRLGLPGISATQVETQNFLLVGNVGPETLADYGQQAEALVPKIASLFQASAEDQPLIKGRLTLYFFQQRYDYSEFGKMVEKRPLPAAWRGHWRFSVIDAYGALVPPRSGDDSLDALLAQQIAGAYLGSLPGQPPRWFAEGSARVAVARLASSDPRVAEWDEQFPQVRQSLSKPEDFLAGRLAPEASDVLAYKFVEFLMSRKHTRQYNSLLRAVGQGEPFAAAFSEAYGGTEQQWAEQWLRTPPRATRRR